MNYAIYQAASRLLGARAAGRTCLSKITPPRSQTGANRVARTKHQQNRGQSQQRSYTTEYRTPKEYDIYQQPRESSPWAYLYFLMPAACFGLAYWQLQRLEWKKKLIRTREEGLRAEPIPLSLENDPVDYPRELAWRPVAIEGKWLHHKEVHMVPRVYEGKGGAHIITPLETAQGRILVNRGFVPTEKLDHATRPESLTKGTVTVKGTLREIASKPNWVPENDPKKNCWYWVDIPALALHTDSDPFFLEELLDLDHPTRLPVGGQLHQPLSNNHFQYVLTWTSLGFILTGMSYLLVRRGRVPPSARPPYIVPPKHRKGGLFN